MFSFGEHKKYFDLCLITCSLSEYRPYSSICLISVFATYSQPSLLCKRAFSATDVISAYFVPIFWIVKGYRECGGLL